MTETTLAQRLRTLADVLDDAANVGVPLPFCVSVDGHPLGGVRFHADAAEFAAWVEYAEAAVLEYERGGEHWRRATTDVDGLQVDFAMVVAEVEAAS